MKKIYLFKNLRKVFQLSFLMLLLFSFFAGKINAQTYVNSNLSTGATTSTGTTAPAGFTWSELQLTNTTLGSAGSLSAGFTLADDFTVPAGPSWNVGDICLLRKVILLHHASHQSGMEYLSLAAHGYEGFSGPGLSRVPTLISLV